MKKTYFYYSIFILLLFSTGCNGTENTTECVNASDCLSGQYCSEDGTCAQKADTADGFHPDDSIDQNNGNDDTELYDSDNEQPDNISKTDDSPEKDRTDADMSDENDRDVVNDEDSFSVDGGEVPTDIDVDTTGCNDNNDCETGAVCNDGMCCEPTGCSETCGDVIDNGCGGVTDCRCEPDELFSNLADPDIYRDRDDYYYLSGTRSAISFDIYGSSDLVTFADVTTFNPSELVGASHSYCWMWAPDIYQTPEGEYRFYFSAKELSAGFDCTQAHTASDSDVTTFYSVYDVDEGTFSHPVAIDFGAGNPQSRIQNDCLSSGCEKTVRIDSALYFDGADEWFFYTWFEGGNNISSIKMEEPGSIITNTQPSPGEGNINEGADVFERDGWYYLFYSINSFDAEYAMKYIKAHSVDELTRVRHAERFSTPITDTSGELLRTHGHSAVAEHSGEYYIFYHVGLFATPGTLSGRNTWKKRLFFRPDGSLQPLNTIDIGWSSPGDDYEFSLDVKPKDESWVGPCIGAAALGGATQYTYRGICPDSSDRMIDKSRIEAIRLYYSNDGTWSDDRMVELPFDGVSGELSVAVPGGSFDHLKIRFAEQKTGDIYSIDIKPSGKDWLSPCIASGVLSPHLSDSDSFSYTFTGTCLSAPDAGTFVPISSIEKIRVCSDADETWSSPLCVEADYDGSSRYIEIW